MFETTLESEKEASKVSTKKLFYFSIKRLFDIFVSLIGIILMIPFVAIVKMAYIVTGDFSSIFYAQTRIGKDGKRFRLYKIRSMVKDADKVLERTLELDPILNEEWQQNQKLENDPRITKIGKVIRKLSIDELPQFINILKGDMSLIGPRPLVLGELDSHKGNHELYESVRPGITGWWACNGRSATTYEKRLELEYYYCRNCCLTLDFKCVFLTIKAVVLKEGAK